MNKKKLPGLNSIDKLFNPHSIAVVGASRDTDKVGGVILANILHSKYKGDVYAVNPNANKVQGLKSYSNISQIEGKVDLAVIAIPAKFVSEVLKECGVKGIQNVVIISAGYGEGDEGGLERQHEVMQIAEKFHLNILGPNCLGFINKSINLNASFGKTPEKLGKVLFASQSGAMGTAFLDWIEEVHLGIKEFISLGNKAVVDEVDILKYAAAQKSQLSSILLYLENFVRGREFFEEARILGKELPIIVLKAGVSEEAQKAISTHTGAIVSDKKVVATALKQANVIKVNTIEEMYNLAMMFEWQPLPKGNRVAIVTNAGGVAVHLVDELEANGLEVDTFSVAEQKILKTGLPETASAANPIDLLGDALADRYKQVLDKVIKSKNVDIVVVVLTPQLMTESALTAKYVNDIADKHDTTVITTFVGGEDIQEAEEVLYKEKIPQFEYPGDAARALGLLWKWVKNRDNIKLLKHPTRFYVNKQLQAEPGQALPLEQARKLFREFNIPLMPAGIGVSLGELKKLAKNIHYPLVLKLSHPSLLHKTELNAVELDLSDEAELEEAFNNLERIAKKQKLVDYSYEMQPFVEDKLEIIIGSKKDKGFGQVITFGSGGIYAEVYHDLAAKLVPLNKNDIEAIIAETKIHQILKGARGKKYNLEAVKQVLSSLSKLLEYNSNIKELDINPLFVTEKEAFAVDIKILL